MYGTQAAGLEITDEQKFENDVKMYGTQAIHHIFYGSRRLRMM